MRRVTFALLASFLLLTACGSDDSSGSSQGSGLDDEAQELADALGREIHQSAQEDTQPGEPELTTDEADCIGAAMVSTLGVDDLAQLGVTAETIESRGLEDLDDPEFTEEQAGTMWDAVTACVDFGGLMADTIAGDGISRESAECIGQGMTALPEFRDMMIGQIVGQDVDDAEMEAAIMGPVMRLMGECMSDEEFAELMES